jgi:hypothetical protein
MRRISLAFMVLAVLMFTINLFAGDAKYVGVSKCKTCHKQEKYGDQYTLWEKGPHANAMKSLSSKEALEYAEKNKIADPAKDAGCLSCHSTQAAVDAKMVDPKGKLTMEEGVSCESCHGPGSEYKSPKLMKKSAYDEDFAAAHKATMAAGLVEPTEKVCVTCHNEKNPFHKPFKFAEYAKKIAHPVPYRK